MAPTPLMAMEICSEGEAKTVWLDAEGNDHPAPHDCRSCAACNLHGVADTDQAPVAAKPAIWHFAAHLTRSADVEPIRYRASPQSRAPPPAPSRNNRPFVTATTNVAAGAGPMRVPMIDQAVGLRATVRTSAA